MIINNIPNKSDSGGNSLHYSNLVLEVASFVTFTAENAEEQKLIDDGYIYRASLSVEGIQENMTPEMVLSTSDIADANADISNLCRCYNGGVYSYSKKVPTKDIAVLTLKVSWNDIDTGVINMITPETIGAARAAHATQHGTDGSDPITPEMIGAVSSEDFKATVVRPNLLDNWYFGNPVNQRGQTEYSAGYTVDRWFNANANGVSSVAGGGIELNPATGDMYFRQKIGELNGLLGKKLTFSVLTADNRLLSVTGVSPDTVPSSANTFASNMDNADLRIFVALLASSKFQVSINVYSGYTVTILAAKLELGEGQTLAHQDENGNWVLNEIPNYAEALAKCQRYFVRIKADGNRYGTIAPGFANSTTLFRFYLAVPCTLRSAPAVVMSGSWGAASDGASYTLTSMSAYARTAGEVTITAATDNNSAITPGNFAHLYTAGDETAYIDLDANL